MTEISSLESSTAKVTSDQDAIEELHSLFEAQKAAFQRNMYPSYEERIALLGALDYMLKSHRKEIWEALSEDFIVHPPQITDACELLSGTDKVKYMSANLKKWMKPQRRPIDRLFYGLSRAYIMYQPVGVVGNMSPWNFPVDVSVGECVDILAAGNRVIIKPSELAPASAELVKEMVTKTFDREQVAVVTGGLDLAREFTRMPWDHLLYTGGPSVAKQVMKAASENLTPVTLELGGKSPVIVAKDSVNESTVADILAVKLVKNGQMCVSVDYVFIPENMVDRFVSLSKKIAQEMLSSDKDNPQHTAIINEKNYDRLLSYLEDASEKGASIVQLYPLHGSPDRNARRIPLSLVLNPNDDMAVMQEEIFGPILPVMTFRHIDEVISYVNNHERPLALYFYTKDKSQAERMLKRTISGGVSINSSIGHAMHPSLTFGGTGNSGMGRHHGFEGFQNYSHHKGVFKSGFPYSFRVFYPPYGKKLEKAMDWTLKIKKTPDRKA